jgi:hypothetical protein
MDANFNAEEREVVKLVHYFKKRAERLIEENKLDANYSELLQTCDKLVEQLQVHAGQRAEILKERDLLQTLVRDNAACPKCNTRDQLKLSGIDTSKEGWKSNKYKCRKCNIEFVWVAPNNPWDMVPYIEKHIFELDSKLQVADSDVESKLPFQNLLENMKANLGRLKPIVEASDKDLKELEERENEISEVVKKFKKHLQIEKIRMED